MLIIIIKLLVDFCLVGNKSIMVILDSNFFQISSITQNCNYCSCSSSLPHNTRFHNTSMTVSHISDSILGSKFGWLSKKPQNWNRVSGLYASASDDSQVPGLKIMTCQWTLLGQDDYLSVIILLSYSPCAFLTF